MTELTIPQIQDLLTGSHTLSGSVVLRQHAEALARQLLATMQENEALRHDIERQIAIANAEAAEAERLREALRYISFASRGCPVVVDGECVPEKWQDVLRDHFQKFGQAADSALGANVGP